MTKTRATTHETGSTSTGGFDAAAHAARMRARGLWADRTLDALFVEAARAHPGKDALVAWRADAPRDAPPRRFSYDELAATVERAAASLRGLGIGARDVVSVQLPNWWEFAVVALACGRVGAAVNPLMPIFRERELTFMLGFSEAKLLVVPKTFRGFDHESMARSLRERLPTLRHVAVVDGDGDDGFERVLLSSRETLPPPAREADAPLRADEMAVLMFTSGTTGEPKGVMHSANSLHACIRALAERFRLDAGDVLLGCSPLGHMTGYAAVLFQGLTMGMTVVLQDVWEPARGVDIMVREKVTHVAASTPFLVDICAAVEGGAPRPSLRTFLCSGATIPPVVIARAAEVLDLGVSSLWGMTESLCSTLTEPERAREKSSSTDGRTVEGVDVKVIDADGREQPVGTTGELKVRGAQMFMGYYKRPDIPTFDADGWFDTGDLAYTDADGYIRISGRTKDVLIRGGENVPVVEIENLLYQHPAVAAAALVGIPDARLGERGCAFVVLKPGASLDLAGLQAWMERCKAAKPYWPERLEIVDALPMTPSGKVQKFALRERAKAFAGA